MKYHYSNTDYIMLSMQMKQDIFAIYYQHYGRAEIAATKRQKSARLLGEMMNEMGYYNVDEYHGLEDFIDIRMSLLQEIADHAFKSQYKHRSKNCRIYWARSIGLKFREVVSVQDEMARSVYALIT